MLKAFNQFTDRHDVFSDGIWEYGEKVHSLDDRNVLSKSLLMAGKELGLSASDLATTIGIDQASLARGIDPDSKSGQLARLLIGCYRDIYVLVGQDRKNIRHWMQTENRHTQGVPAEQIKTIQGLTQVAEHLDAMRGKSRFVICAAACCTN